MIILIIISSHLIYKLRYKRNLYLFIIYLLIDVYEGKQLVNEMFYPLIVYMIF